MNTHILYYVEGAIIKYFAGTYTGELDTEGYSIVDFVWTYDINEATVMNTTDAWDLLGMCRLSWPTLKLELKRIHDANYR